MASVFTKMLPVAFRPTFVNGRWRKPKLSRRKIAQVRKQVLMAGMAWPFERIRNAAPVTKFKGHKADKQHRERYDCICILIIRDIVVCVCVCVCVYMSLCLCP
jgi:hypothetical protein